MTVDVLTTYLYPTVNFGGPGSFTVDAEFAFLACEIYRNTLRGAQILRLPSQLPREQETVHFAKEGHMKMLIAIADGVILCSLLGASTAWAQSRQPSQTGKSAVADLLSRVTKVKGIRLASNSSLQPPSDALCRTDLGFPCYSPQQIRNAYGLTPLLQAGFTGAGQTIIIVDSFGSPTIAQDLKTFDASYGLPDPPSFKVLAPLGTVPFDPTDSVQVGWALETTLDVEWAHVMAPGAAIVLLTSPVAETQGVPGLPQFLALEKYALNHKLGKIISQSWGTAENTLFDSAGQQVIAEFEDFYQDAGQDGVTVLASAGDGGTSNVDVDNNLYPFTTVLFPASSPWVTAVGGTSLYADTSGKYLFEIVWNDLDGAAGGGGVSQQFSEPFYQYSLPGSVQKTLDNYRGVPDVAYNADPLTPILIYVSFLGSDNAGFYFIGGTSEGSPQWAGIVAVANQLAGHPVGFLNPKLYAIGEQFNFFHDITFGSNASNGLPGYLATRGWDLSTGWGTPDLGSLIREMAQK
jgi:subtilase family serine protease